MRLEGKVALITGAASGMGAAQAELFAREGAAVCVADLNAENGNAIVDKIKGNGGKAIFARLDVTKSEQWAEVADRVEKEFGSLSILCNNAGANFRVSFDEQTEEMWHIVMDTAITGAFLGIKACAPALRRANGASIVNMGSLASTRPGGGSPAYAASKSGMVGLTISAAKSYAKDGIRCNMVSPGHVDTPFIRQSNPHSPNDWSTSIDNPENYERRLANTPLGRLQTPMDVANAFLFLVSDDAAMITGVNLKVDGGAGM